MGLLRGAIGFRCLCVLTVSLEAELHLTSCIVLADFIDEALKLVFNWFLFDLKLYRLIAFITTDGA